MTVNFDRELLARGCAMVVLDYILDCISRFHRGSARVIFNTARSALREMPEPGVAVELSVAEKMR
jgi:hypothetical protein